MVFHSERSVNGWRGMCFGVAIMVAIGHAAGGWGVAQESAAETELDRFVAAYQQAYNEQDVAAAGKLWSEKAEYVDEQAGLRLSGRQEILDAYAELFKQDDAGQLAVEVVSSRSVTSEVITIEALSRLSHAGEVVTSRFLATLVKQAEGNWQIDSAREIPMVEVEGQHSQLKQLQWLVGEWQEETDSHKVWTSVQWSSSRSFLIRTYTAWQNDQIDVEGAQIIGWDPREKRIRSWSFDSTGSFGEEQWSLDDGKWVIQLKRTLADGTAATAVQIMSEVEPGVVEVQVRDIDVEGQSEPNPEPTRLYRVTDAPVAPGEMPQDSGVSPEK